MKKRSLYLLLPILTIVLEILPYGAICNFADSSTDKIRKAFSYFDPTPWGYANFFPLLTAIVSCLILAFLALYCLKGNIRAAIRAKTALYVAIPISLGPLLLGADYFSLVGGLITLSLIGELILIQFTNKKSK